MFTWQSSNCTVRYELPLKTAIIKTADSVYKSQIGVTEKGSNRGKEVLMYLSAVSLGGGNPYCAAFIVWGMKTAIKVLGLDAKKYLPFRATGLANGIFSSAKKKGTKTDNQPQQHDLIVWKYPNSNSGHIGYIDSVGKAGWVYTVEANTSGNNKGSQRDGSGVWRKKRNWKSLLGRMKVRGFVGFYDPEVREALESIRKILDIIRQKLDVLLDNGSNINQQTI